LGGRAKPRHEHLAAPVGVTLSDTAGKDALAASVDHLMPPDFEEPAECSAVATGVAAVVLMVSSDFRLRNAVNMPVPCRRTAGDHEARWPSAQMTITREARRTRRPPATGVGTAGGSDEP